MRIPETKYAKSGDLNIAYQQFGKGERDLVLIPGWASNIEQDWNFPEYASFLNKFGAFSRVTIIDRRGTGLSDPVHNAPTIEERMDDVRAVMDDAGIESATILGISEGGPMAIVFGASFPERVEALALYGSFARMISTEGYPEGVPKEVFDKYIGGLEQRWGQGKSAKLFCPSRANDETFIRYWGANERNAMGPGAARRMLELSSITDVRDVLPSLRVPTLVLHRRGDMATPVSLGRYLAEHIPGAKYVELAGEDHFPGIGDVDSIVSEIQQLLTGERAVPEPDRILTTIMFVDIVQSTEKVAEIGDHAWKELLERYYDVARSTLTRYRGREINTAGDGFFASFDGPARAVRCGIELHEAIGSMGLKLRVGAHTGECEVFGDTLSGIAVHIGARVAGQAEPGEILVSSTVKDLTVGSGLSFNDRGAYVLKGVPGEWRLFSVAN